jgi:hypothetical protein
MSHSPPLPPRKPKPARTEAISTATRQASAQTPASTLTPSRNPTAPVRIRPQPSLRSHRRCCVRLATSLARRRATSRSFTSRAPPSRRIAAPTAHARLCAVATSARRHPTPAAPTRCPARSSPHPAAGPSRSSAPRAPARSPASARLTAALGRALRVSPRRAAAPPARSSVARSSAPALHRIRVPQPPAACSAPPAPLVPRHRLRRAPGTPSPVPARAPEPQPPPCGTARSSRTAAPPTPRRPSRSRPSLRAARSSVPAPARPARTAPRPIPCSRACAPRLPRPGLAHGRGSPGRRRARRTGAARRSRPWKKETPDRGRTERERKKTEEKEK